MALPKARDQHLGSSASIPNQVITPCTLILTKSARLGKQETNARHEDLERDRCPILVLQQPLEHRYYRVAAMMNTRCN